MNNLWFDRIVIVGLRNIPPYPFRFFLFWPVLPSSSSPIQILDYWWIIYCVKTINSLVSRRTSNLFYWRKYTSLTHSTIWNILKIFIFAINQYWMLSKSVWRQFSLINRQCSFCSCLIKTRLLKFHFRCLFQSMTACFTAGHWQYFSHVLGQATYVASMLYIERKKSQPISSCKYMTIILSCERKKKKAQVGSIACIGRSVTSRYGFLAVSCEFCLIQLLAHYWLSFIIKQFGDGIYPQFGNMTII